MRSRRSPAPELAARDLDAALEAAPRADGIVDAFGLVGNGEGPVYVALAEVHEARGEKAEAEAAIRKGIGFIERRLAKIADPALRRSFEERIPSHAWLLRRAPR